MAWIQVKIQSSGQNSAHIEDLLMGLGAVSVTLEDSGDQPLLEPPLGTTPVWDDTTFTGLFDADINTDLICAALINSLGANTPIKVATLEEKDWVREWMDTFEPIRFGDRLWVCPSWHTPPEPDAVNLLLDPGLAFGTGTHETTSLCLQWLDKSDLTGKTVVDFGCGSGILAIAAALLGAERVLCIDNDPQALMATRANAERNKVSQRLEVVAPRKDYQFSADIVLANILAAPLIQLSSLLAGLTHSGGLIVLSGILENQANDVSKAYQPWFNDLEIVQKGDWVRISGAKSV